MPDYDAIIVGGGFFGCKLALLLKARGVHTKILIVEKEADLLLRASYANQARVHNGYHYPRSLVTAMRSRLNYIRFLEEYGECVSAKENHYYAIARAHSNITANQFVRFCERIGAELRAAPETVKRNMSPDLIEEVFFAQEAVFDADALRARMCRDLEVHGIEAQCNMRANKIVVDTDALTLWTAADTGAEKLFTTSYIYNCTYSSMNDLLLRSGLPVIPLKHELTEMAFIEAPEELRNTALTVMCGPFFSIMPFPARAGLHTLSHVRYTPHHAWKDSVSSYRDPHAYLATNRANLQSHFAEMIHDVRRYIPAMRGARHVDSLWEVKTLLPRNEIDDGRPILIAHPGGRENITCILGGKIDNVYDIDVLWNT